MTRFKKLAVISAFVSILVVGCGEDTEKIDNFKSSQDIDKGNYQSVIDRSNNCTGLSGKEKENCLTNLGAAYFGLANFDLISLGQELLEIDTKDNLDDDAKSKEFNKVVMGKLLSDDLKGGIDCYNRVLADKKKKCNKKDIDVMTKGQKNACYAVNPILLKDSLGGDGGSDLDTTMNLETLVDFADVLEDAAPGLDADDLVSIINGDDEELPASKDINQNKVLDKLEATSCALKAYNAGATTNFNICKNDKKIIVEELKADVFKKDPYKNITSVKVTVANVNGNKNVFYRLIKKKNASKYTSVSVNVKVAVDEDLAIVSKSVDGKNTFYEPIAENGKLSTFDESITETLNDKDKFKQIALLTNAQEDDMSESEKIKKLQKEICGDNIINASTANCTKSGDNVTISEEAIFKYMQGD